MIKTHLLNGNYAAIGSHDEEIINFTKQLAKEHAIQKTQFEFQMLFGIREELQKNLFQKVIKYVFMYHTEPIGTAISCVVSLNACECSIRRKRYIQQ